MSGYKNGKIYKLTCSETDKVYIGSTIQTLNDRLSRHKSKSNTCVTKDFINPKIELIEAYPCETKQELWWKEREYMEKTDCVNIILPIIRYEERKERHDASVKIYQEKNREKINARQNEKITCECGAIISRANKIRHFISKKHLNYVSGENTKR